MKAETKKKIKSALQDLSKANLKSVQIVAKVNKIKNSTLLNKIKREKSTVESHKL